MGTQGFMQHAALRCHSGKLHFVKRCSVVGSHRRVPPLRCFSEEVESCDIADQDCFSVSLHLQEARLELQAAVDAEDFIAAAHLRDKVQNLELAHRSLAVAHNKQQTAFPVGTCMRHRVYGYRGVIVGYDLECLAPSNWQETMKVHLLTHGPSQPFYHVLVDGRDRPGGQTTYVAQENIVPSRKPHHIEHPLLPRYLQILDAEDGTWSYLPRSDLRELYKDDF